jgi:hypothetical protein
MPGVPRVARCSASAPLVRMERSSFAPPVWYCHDLTGREAVKEPASDVGGGCPMASVTDPDGNGLGLAVPSRYPPRPESGAIDHQHLLERLADQCERSLASEQPRVVAPRDKPSITDRQRCTPLPSKGSADRADLSAAIYMLSAA